MKKKKFIILGIVFLSVCFLFFAAIKVSKDYFTADGSSIKKAIVIESKGDHLESIGQEYGYIADNFGDRGQDWMLMRQKMVEENGKFYDLLTIKIAGSSEEKTLYFDITEPFLELQKQYQSGK